MRFAAHLVATILNLSYFDPPPWFEWNFYFAESLRTLKTESSIQSDRTSDIIFPFPFHLWFSFPPPPTTTLILFCSIFLLSLDALGWLACTFPISLRHLKDLPHVSWAKVPISGDHQMPAKRNIRSLPPPPQLTLIHFLLYFVSFPP